MDRTRTLISKKKNLEMISVVEFGMLLLSLLKSVCLQKCFFNKEFFNM